MKISRSIVLVALIFTAAFFGFQTFQLEQQKNEMKNDLIELSKIQYGLFNVDEWKIILAEIITEKIEEFNLEHSNREEMKKKIDSFLKVAINELEEGYYEKKSKSITGLFSSGVAYATGIFGVIKQDIPKFTDQILDFLNDKENRKAIRSYLIKKLNTYTDETFSKTDYSKVITIQNKYGQSDSATTKQQLENSIIVVDENNKSNKLMLIGIAVFSLLFLLLLPNATRFELGLFLFICFVFLAIGVLLPMIEIDARLSSISFSLLGQKIQFTDQVLYFKSKSILEVVKLMVFQNRVDLVLVGLLVLTFSVLFPIVKLISSFIYLLDPKKGNNSFISFMVFKSGKWSMADVMVIAVFMAYIGFDGIISEQLNQLEKIAPNLDLLTTNKSSLLFGFYSFTMFVLLGLFASQKIQSSTAAS